jgi:hypothetical protein
VAAGNPTRKSPTQLGFSHYPEALGGWVKALIGMKIEV